MKRALAAVALVGLLAGCSSSHGSDPSAAISAVASPIVPASSPPPSSSAPALIDAAGFVTVTGQYSTGLAGDGSVCWTRGNIPGYPGTPTPYDDIKKGAQIVVSDATGKTVGLGKLSDGETISSSGVGGFSCRFPFIVTGVTAGSRFFGLKVGEHASQVPASRMQAIRMSYGN